MSGRTFSPGHDASIDYLRSAKIKLAILATYASLFVDRDDRAMTRRMSVASGPLRRESDACPLNRATPGGARAASRGSRRGYAAWRSSKYSS